jgi:hypothetical protein
VSTINPKGAAVSRRTLRFSTIDEALAEVDRCIASERAGTLRHTGTWTTGQIFGHLAGWITYAYDGVPKQFRPPNLLILLLARMFRGMVLDKPMPAGMKLAGTPVGTFSTEAVSAEEGCTRLRRELIRLRHEDPKRPNPILGAMSHTDWIKLHLRHCELHLSFLHPTP